MFSRLQYLRLDYNLIENVYPLFVSSNRLHVLSLKGNRIRHFDIESYPINWLTHLRLNDNPNDFELECNAQLTDFRFNRLQSQQLARKKISTAILLSCSHNLIHTINEDFFDSAINLEKL
ncbi:hypothetical protein GJ496_003460 [Pomphorhynchus laevis]|nr:hypothetical protein GJ496_003460 [Pomphorhynchus laevis]